MSFRSGHQATENCASGLSIRKENQFRNSSAVSEFQTACRVACCHSGDQLVTGLSRTLMGATAQRPTHSVRQCSSCCCESVSSRTADCHSRLADSPAGWQNTHHSVTHLLHCSGSKDCGGRKSQLHQEVNMADTAWPAQTSRVARRKEVQYY